MATVFILNTISQSFSKAQILYNAKPILRSPCRSSHCLTTYSSPYPLFASLNRSSALPPSTAVVCPHTCSPAFKEPLPAYSPLYEYRPSVYVSSPLAPFLKYRGVNPLTESSTKALIGAAGTKALSMDVPNSGASLMSGPSYGLSPMGAPGSGAWLMSVSRAGASPISAPKAGAWPMSAPGSEA